MTCDNRWGKIAENDLVYSVSVILKNRGQCEINNRKCQLQSMFTRSLGRVNTLLHVWLKKRGKVCHHSVDFPNSGTNSVVGECNR